MTIDGALLSTPAAAMHARLRALVIDSHVRGGLDPVAAEESAAPIVLDAFRISCEVRRGVWIPRSVVKVGRLTLRGR